MITLDETINAYIDVVFCRVLSDIFTYTSNFSLTIDVEKSLLKYTMITK